jgi:cell division protein YceG involved in septum cleavage
MKKLFVLFFGLALLAATAWYALPLWPANIPAGGVNISVRQGSSLSRLANDLERAEVAPALVVQAVARSRGSARKLRAGEYLFEAPQSVADVLNAIESGNARQLAITVVEGSRLSDLYGQLQPVSSPAGAATFATESLPERAKLSETLPSDVSELEGYFFPDTYFVAPGRNG